MPKGQRPLVGPWLVHYNTWLRREPPDQPEMALAPKTPPHKWQFRARFRRQAFGWKSQPAMTRIKEAVAEIKKVARQDQTLAAAGAVLFLTKLSPAIEHVDGSSGAIGMAVNNAIAELVPIIARAPAEAKIRDQWLEEIWEAYQEDDIPYLESLGDYWGELCGSPEVASSWADRLESTCRMAWSPDPELRGYFKGTSNCLSCLLAAARYDELLELIKLAPHNMWYERQYGVKALAAMGKIDEAIRYAQNGDPRYDYPGAIARACEEILLACGRMDEAYSQYGLMANEANTNLAWFRAVAKKYPHKTPVEILDDLVDFTPGQEGKWFAAAKSMGLYDQAIALANRTPCAPQTLTRAARDFAAKEPAFAIEAGITALRWLAEGYGYDITSFDVRDAYSYAMQAAANVGREEETKRRIMDLVAQEAGAGGIVRKSLGIG